MFYKSSLGSGGFSPSHNDGWGGYIRYIADRRLTAIAVASFIGVNFAGRKFLVFKQ
jgi:hypothetical protein